MRKLVILCLLIAIASAQFLTKHNKAQDTSYFAEDESTDNQLDTQDDHMYRPVGRNLIKCLGEVRNMIKQVVSMISQVKSGTLNIADGVKQIVASLKTIKNECISGGQVDPEINDAVNQLQSATQSTSKVSLLTKLAGLFAMLEVKMFF